MGIASRLAWLRLLLAGAAQIAFLAGQTPVDGSNLAGNWIDSQGNHFTIEGAYTGSVLVPDLKKAAPEPKLLLANYFVRCNSCRFLIGEKKYDLPLNVSTVRNAANFEGRDQQNNVVLTFPALIGPAGTIRLNLSIGAAGDKLSTVLVRSSEAQGAATGRAKRVNLQLTQFSAKIGTWIPMFVSLSDEDGKFTAPSDDTVVKLTVEGGTPIPAQVRITSRTPRVPAGIRLSAGQATVQASAPGLPAAAAVATGCDVAVGELRMKMDLVRDQASADGKETIPAVLSMVDANDTPASDGKAKHVGFNLGGVGRLAATQQSAAKAVVVGAGQCIEERQIVADRAGEGVISAEFRGKEVKRSYLFRPRLTPVAFAVLLLGGVLGGVVSAGRNYAAVSKWRRRRWLFWLGSACTGAVALYLSYLYALFRHIPNFNSDSGFALLIGLLGGYLGAAVLDRLTGPQTADNSNSVSRQPLVQR